jgi:hypothetical protein
VKSITPLEVLPVTTYDRVRPLLRPLCIAEKSAPPPRRRPASHADVREPPDRLVSNPGNPAHRAHLRGRRDQRRGRDLQRTSPAPGELFATLLIEYAEPAEHDVELARLVGLERHLWMALDGRRVASRFDERQMSPDRISAVQFIAFPLGDEAGRFGELAAAGKVAIEVDHPRLSLRVPIEGPLATALADDLRPD